MSAVSDLFPPSLRAWIKQQVRDRGFASEDEFIRDLVRREKERRDETQWLDANLLDAVESGESRPFTKADWKEIEQQGLARASRRKK